jgi:hypothetical protein
MNERAPDDSHPDDMRLDAAPEARAYRAAAAQLNETPSPAVRATVLAAAARAVQARPTGVRADGSMPPLRGNSRYRLPLAAAASVLVGTIAVLLAQRTEEQQPAADRVAAAVPEPILMPKPISRPEARPEARAPEQQSEIAQMPTAMREQTSKRVARPDTDAAPAATGPRASADTRASSHERAPMVDGAGRADRADRADTPAPVRAAESAPAVLASAENEVAANAATAPKQEALAGVAAVATDNRAAAATPAAPPAWSKEQAIAARNEDHVTARPVARSAPIAGSSQNFGPQQPAAAAPPPAAEPQRRSSFAAAGDVSADPQRWAEWIAMLRSQGQHDLADAQLKLLRERYPDFTVPASALRAP